VHGLSVQYFDTIFPCTNLNILRPGFLFTAGEFNNHITYTFNDIGDNDPNPIRTFSAEGKDKLTTFNPRGDPINLVPTDEFQNLASINDLKVEDLLKEGTP
jgi:splicing factor 3B subunit 3